MPPILYKDGQSYLVPDKSAVPNLKQQGWSEEPPAVEVKTSKPEPAEKPAPHPKQKTTKRKT